MTKVSQLVQDIPMTMQKETEKVILGNNLLSVETFVQMLVPLPNNGSSNLRKKNSELKHTLNSHGPKFVR